jgi:hypothetical protein
VEKTIIKNNKDDGGRANRLQKILTKTQQQPN